MSEAFVTWYLATVKVEVESESDEGSDFLFDHKTACEMAWKAALEEAARVADAYGSDHYLQAPNAWNEEETQWWETGGIDHCIAIAAAIRALGK